MKWFSCFNNGHPCLTVILSFLIWIDSLHNYCKYGRKINVFLVLRVRWLLILFMVNFIAGIESATDSRTRKERYSECSKWKKRMLNFWHHGPSDIFLFILWISLLLHCTCKRPAELLQFWQIKCTSLGW